MLNQWDWSVAKDEAARLENIVFSQKLAIPASYQVVVADVDFVKDSVRVISVEKLLGALV